MTEVRWASAKLRRIWRPRPRHAAILALFVLPALFVPRIWCGRGAAAHFEGNAAAQEALASEVVRWVESGVTRDDFNTGFELFNGEWSFGTYQMAALGLLQVVQEHPETGVTYLPVVEQCLERLSDDDIRAFDTAAWGSDALDTLDAPDGHAAYLGYFNLALGLYRQVVAEPKFNELNDKITAALARRFEASRSGLLETYPGEAYPVDNAAALASIALYDGATGADHSQLIAAWAARCRRDYVDEGSGLLFQAVDVDSCTPLDKPRASGTALAAYFLSFADLDLSKELFSALKKSCATSFIGFGLIKEYPPNVEKGRGDIDSGPVVMGLSFSGTGFTLASCRIHGDRELYTAIYRTSHLVGAPLDSQGRRTYVCGGPLGNAIMLAMLTAGGAS